MNEYCEASFIRLWVNVPTYKHKVRKCHRNLHIYYKRCIADFAEPHSDPGLVQPDPAATSSSANSLLQQTDVAQTEPTSVDAGTIHEHVKNHHRIGRLAEEGWSDLPSYLERSPWTPQPRASTGATQRRRDTRTTGGDQKKKTHNRLKAQRRKRNQRQRKMIAALETLGTWVAAEKPTRPVL